MTTIVVIAHATDAGAASVAALLRHVVGAACVVVLRPEALSIAKWSHRVDERGRATTVVALPGVSPLPSSAIGAVLNRIRFVPTPRFRAAPAKDRDYAAAEMEALVASWLAELGDRVVHTVRAHPWVTPVVSLHWWASAAAAAGLPVAPRTIATSARWGPPEDTWGETAVVPAGAVLVADDEVEGPLAGRFGDACRAAARALGLPLLEFRFGIVAGQPALVAVDPMPPLERRAAVEATCRLLIVRRARAVGSP